MGVLKIDQKKCNTKGKELQIFTVAYAVYAKIMKEFNLRVNSFLLDGKILVLYKLKCVNI